MHTDSHSWARIQKKQTNSPLPPPFSSHSVGDCPLEHSSAENTCSGLVGGVSHDGGLGRCVDPQLLVIRLHLYRDSWRSDRLSLASPNKDSHGGAGVPSPSLSSVPLLPEHSLVLRELLGRLGGLSSFPKVLRGGREELRKSP